MTRSDYSINEKRTQDFLFQFHAYATTVSPMKMAIFHYLKMFTFTFPFTGSHILCYYWTDISTNYAMGKT